MTIKEIKKQIKFGTDGWRAVISENFTFENVRIISQAISIWVKKDLKVKKRKPKIALGFDTRFLSREYAETVTKVLVANGIVVYLSEDAIPTPALSYGVVQIKADAGIMITASHNPAKFNGVKIKTSLGGGAPSEITDRVEKYLCKESVKMMELADAKKANLVKMFDYKVDYLKFIRSYLNLKKIKKSKFKVLTDVMHGSGGTLMKEALKGTDVRISLMREDVNPSFDGTKPEPVIEYLDKIISRVKKDKFDLGLVLDGDGDRIAAVAPGGEFINPQKVLALLVLHLHRNCGRTGAIVKTICGSEIMDNISKILDLKLHETPVGFKYISDLMISEKIIVGGEEAGGMGVQDFIPERDGTLAGLLLLEMMVCQKKNIKQILDEMEKEFGRYYYVKTNIKLKKAKFNPKKVKSIKTLLGKKVVDMKDYDGVKLICEDTSWLMFRPSGTEPLVRVYAEAKTLKRANQLLALGDRLLRK